MLILEIRKITMSIVAKVDFRDYRSSVGKALDLIGVAERLPQDRFVIIKPNLTNSNKPPTTTDVRAVEAVYLYCRDNCKTEIAVGEGTGNGVTKDTFRANGYTELAEKCRIRLIDFNQESAVRLENDDALQWKEFYLPEIALGAFIISLPVLKDHSFTVTTISMKNMFGLLPDKFKAKYHAKGMNNVVVDINTVLRSTLTVIDGFVGMEGRGPVWGTPVQMNLIIAGTDPVATDATACRVMGVKPRKIHYIQRAYEKGLGEIDDVDVLGERLADVTRVFKR